MMALQEALDNILQAVFGRDVRQSIHDGIKTANDKVDEYTKKQDALDIKYDNLLDELSKSDPSLAEVVDARIKEDGTGYSSLRERLNAADSKFEAYKNQLFSLIYPVGCIYMSASPTDPAELFGGTWVSWGAGKVPVGVDTSQTEFSTVEKTGGEKAHTLLSSELARHSHGVARLEGSVSSMIGQVNSSSNGIVDWSVGGYGTGELTTGESAYAKTAGAIHVEATHEHSDVGENEPHNNLQPYITCYMWKRTA